MCIRDSRTETWACPPVGTTPVDAHFVPLFLYESLSGLVGAVVVLMLARRALDRDAPGQLRRRPVQLLVEEVPPARHRLHHEQARCGRVGPAQEGLPLPAVSY